MSKNLKPLNGLDEYLPFEIYVSPLGCFINMIDFPPTLFEPIILFFDFLTISSTSIILVRNPYFKDRSTRRS